VDERQIEVVQDSQDAEGKDLDDLRKKSEAAPIIRLVNQIVADAVGQGASDIHVEPTKMDLRIRHRVDGLLRKTMDLPKWVQGAVVSRIKIMARMDIAEKRLPQDGRIGVRVGGRNLDLRVSTVPANYGEKVVIRILDSANANIPLELIGFSAAEMAKMLDIISRPQGIVLITGPRGREKRPPSTGSSTGSNPSRTTSRRSKTRSSTNCRGSTRWRCRRRSASASPSCSARCCGRTRTSSWWGEMRDLDTTTIAVQAALTGHLVLSTIHTNSSVRRSPGCATSGALLPDRLHDRRDRGAAPGSARSA